MNEFISKVQASRSIRFQIGLLYSFLALINILFFSALIFENQTELLVKNFKFQSENFVNTVMGDLKNKPISKDQGESLTKLQETLKYYEINDYRIFDINGEIWHKSEGEITEISQDLLLQAKEISDVNNVFTSKYKLQLKTEDFTIDFLIPLSTTTDGEVVFLSAKLSIKGIQERLNKLYYQIALAFIWGVISHILFGIYVNKVIFTRVAELKSTTDKMAAGNLKARASWTFKRNDELDVLGVAFNGMAVKIEETIETISRLNEEISKELKIGKEVQEMFLPSNKKLKHLKVATSYRPMREVSGDIYHFYKFPQSKINPQEFHGIFFADASGHGVSAALVTTVMLLSLEGIIAKTINPGIVIQKLSDIIGNRFQSSFFGTSVFFLIGGDGKIFCANAGHNAPIVIRPSTGETFFFKSGGPPLGMADEFNYKVLRMDAKPGDKLFIYSDGLTETPGKVNEEQFSEERVVKLLQQNINLPNPEILELLATELDNWALEYRDDVSMILVEIPA